jgi:hypothetical protein
MPMTTLVAINTMDSLVMGCDSLATVTKTMIDPFDLISYFDSNNAFKIRVGVDGKPLLDSFDKIWGKSQSVPYYHMTHVDKLFSLSPLSMGVMCAGIAAIGDRTVKNIIAEFKSKDEYVKKHKFNHTLNSVGCRLLEFMWGYYEKVYPNDNNRPELEIMLGGYDKQKRTPGIVRINVHKNEIRDVDYDYGVFLGAQAKEIQRLVFGTDAFNKLRLMQRSNEILNKYYNLIIKDLPSGTKVKQPDDYTDELRLFNKDWDLNGIDANWSAFSEQNAIDCVDFLVNIMIRSQQFSTSMPTVGGDVHVAVIKKELGFKFVSKIELKHGDNSIPAEE